MRQGRSRFRSNQPKKGATDFWPRKNDRTKSNRFLGHDQANSKQQAILTFWLVCFILIITGLCWLILFSEPMQIRNIEISGNRNLNKQTIQDVVRQHLDGKYFYFIPKTSLVLFSVKELDKDLNKNFRLLTTEIHRNPLKQKLVINLLEKDYNYVWQEGSVYYYISHDGDIILTKDAPAKDMLLLENTGSTLVNGQKINIDAKYLDYAKELDTTLHVNKRGLSLRTMIYDGTINALKVKLTAGPTLYFNTEMPVTTQLKKLDVLRSNQLPDGHLFNELSYIDLRIGDRIYYQ